MHAYTYIQCVRICIAYVCMTCIGGLVLRKWLSSHVLCVAVRSSHYRSQVGSAVGRSRSKCRGECSPLECPQCAKAKWQYVT